MGTAVRDVGNNLPLVCLASDTNVLQHPAVNKRRLLLLSQEWARQQQEARPAGEKRDKCSPKIIVFTTYYAGLVKSTLGRLQTSAYVCMLYVCMDFGLQNARAKIVSIQAT